jgi:hypothetical protein
MRAPFWARSGPILALFWAHDGPMFGPMFGPMMGPCVAVVKQVRRCYTVYKEIAAVAKSSI